MCVHNMILGFVTALKYLHAKKKELKCRILALQRHVTKIKIEDLLEALLRKKKNNSRLFPFRKGVIFLCVLVFVGTRTNKKQTQRTRQTGFSRRIVM